jgi:hypothetical protein
MYAIWSKLNYSYFPATQNGLALNHVGGFLLAPNSALLSPGHSKEKKK